MRSGKSFFNSTLYRKNLTRFWPVWGLYLVIWLFVLPADLILNGYSKPELHFAQRHVLQSIPEVGLWMSAIFALLAAVAVWSYLFNNRSACLMHTLPIRREGLFLTSFLSGMTFLAGPNLVICVLTLLAEAAAGCVKVGPLVMWFFAVTLMGLFFFCFATFCAMFTGHILGLPAYYGILNILAWGVTYLVDITLSRFVFGYNGVEGLYTLARWLTPAWNLLESLDVRSVQGVAANGELTTVGYEFPTLGYILVYAFLGLILAGIALAVYRRRHMERAGDAVTVTWVRPVFQYGVAFCCALAFGCLFAELFGDVLPDTAWTLLFFMLVCGAVGYFLAKMILEKSFRVFGCWKGCLPFLAVLVVLVCVMEFDLTGFERRVPDERQVSSVSISDLRTRPYDSAQRAVIQQSEDPEVIAAVLDAHQSFVDNKQSIEAENSGRSGWGEVSPLGYYVETAQESGFSVTYYLKNGAAMSRNYAYEIPVYAEDLDKLSTVSGKLNALANLPQVIEASYGLSDETADSLLEVSVCTNFVSEEGYYSQKDVAISKEAWELVLEAVQRDLAEGNLGRRYLMDTEERMGNCFTNDLTFTFYRPANSWADAVDVPTAEVTRPEPYGEEKMVYSQRISVTLQTTAKHTLAALKQVGVLTGQVNLLTQAQMAAADGKYNAQGGTWEGIDLRDHAWAVLGEE